MQKQLIKLANHLDRIGLIKEANYLDNIIKRFAQVDAPTSPRDSAGYNTCYDVILNVNAYGTGRVGEVIGTWIEEGQRGRKGFVPKSPPFIGGDKIPAGSSLSEKANHKCSLSLPKFSGEYDKETQKHTFVSDEGFTELDPMHDEWFERG